MYGPDAVRPPGSRGLPVYKDFVKGCRRQDRLAPDAADHAAEGEVPSPDLRNHRKLMVVDGKVGFTGSLNVTERGYNKPKNHKPDASGSS